MKLTRLEMLGFKSFADTVELPFDDGVTAIVGPNGCGKSNISDAVRWVLGEQRVRLLRGVRMDEVIFQGSVKRRPVNIAEVSLYIDNSDDGLAVAYNEVVVTRRLSRNGQSDYLVNGSPVRLRDLHDLLQGTGLGSDVGVVIEAQMIDRLLSDRPDERRSLFEEAAGIGLYRDRKIGTERRLERTSEDLQRLDDLIAEVQTQVRSLARQRGKAERHEKFLAERFDIVMTLTRRELTRMEDQEAGMRERSSALVARIPRVREELAELQRRRDTQAQARATAEARRSELERRLGETRVQIERLEGDVNLATERLANAETRRARAQEEKQQAEERAAHAEREREAAATERAAAETARHSVQTELDLRSSSEDEVRERLTAHRELVRSTEAERQRQAEILRTLVGEKAAIQRELDALNVQSRDVEQRCESAVRELEQSRQSLAVARSDLEARQRDESAAVSELQRARHSLAAAREQEAALTVERRATDERIAQLRARKEALAELQRAREGLAPAARELLHQRDRFGPDAVLGPLSDYVTTSQSGARQVEHLLADWLHAVLVRDEATVAAVRDWHREAKPGPLVLLPVSPGPVSSGGGEPAELAVEAPAREWVRALLAGSSTLDPEDGAIRRSNGAIFLPSDEVAGPIARRAELDALAGELQSAEHTLNGLNDAARQAADRHAAAQRELERAGTEVETARATLREAQGASDDASRHLHRAERENTESEEAHARLHERIVELSERLVAVDRELAGAERERLRLGQDLESQRAKLADLEGAQEAARERRVHWQVEEAQVSAREEAARDREARALAALSETQHERETLKRELEEIEVTTGELTKSRAQWEDTLADLRVAVQEIEAAASAAEGGVREADAAMTRADESIAATREQLEQLSEQSHAAELELTQAAGERQALVERIEAEWHKPLNELLESFSEIEEETEILNEEAERLARALEALGPVNPLAVHEHAEELKRLQFLQEQRDDLVEARKSLLQALREIDETARRLFLETFAQIRENFGAVFQTLFEGGECDVRLAEETDPLDSPIDIFAAPRGKRTQRIHLLSSGERALVALSLLFSIYLTKPAPFCLLDEVDAPLDDANVTRFVRLLDEFKTETQFIVITHNPRTMQVADAVYGVTMQEPGVSSIVGVRLGAEAVAS
ncbi:MAG: AAA family ATPase [Gemmatimonadota bacterium]|nr:MAG: AAA family ATPase [Gemmatimonadota bacterium]